MGNMQFAYRVQKGGGALVFLTALNFQLSYSYIIQLVIF